MRRICLILALLIGAVSAIWHWTDALAAPGTPGSTDFGYGGWLELKGTYRDDALALAADLPLDWLAISFSWSQYNTTPTGSPGWQQLDVVMRFATRNRLAVMFSLTDTPPSAMTAQGPDGELTALLVQFLAKRYPQTLQAIELYPAANTLKGWGVRPDPAAYMQLYRRVQAGLDAEKLPVLLVAGGLVPLAAGETGMDDVQFLLGLYASGGSSPIPVVSIGMAQISTDLLAPATAENPNVLRRYERIRDVMVKAGHKNDLIWITSISAQSGKITESDHTQSTLTDQGNWLFQAYAQLRAQLYIGVTFYRSLNPAPTLPKSTSLILDGEDYHPFYRVLRTFLRDRPAQGANPWNGRPKDEVLFKRKR